MADEAADGLQPGRNTEMTGELDAAGVVADPGGLLANASSRQLRRNFATAYMSLGIAVLLSLFLTPIILRHMGATDYGLWITIVTAGSYLGILDSGVATAAVQQIATLTAVRDDKKLAELFATVRVFFIITGFLAVGISGILLPFVGRILDLPPGTLDAARISLVLMGVFTAIGFVSSVPSAALYGGGRSDALALLGVGTSVVVQGAQIAVVLLGGGLVGLFVVSTGGALLTLAFTSALASRLHLRPPERGHASRTAMKDLLRQGFRNLTVGLGGSISYGLDSLVIAAILPVARVAPYDIALSTGNFSRNVATAATNMLLPAYAHSSALDDQERQFRLYSRAVLVSMAITIPMAIALFAFGQPLLRLWLGTVPKDTYEILVVLNVCLLMQLPGHQSFLFLTGVGRNKLLARIAMPLALSNLALSVGATFWLGPVGPAVGSLPQVAVVEFFILPLLCCRAMRIVASRYWREAMLPLMIPLTAATLVSLLLLWQVGNSSKILAPVEAVAVVVVAWAALIPYLWRLDPAIRELMMRPLTRLNRRRLGASVSDT